MIKKKILKTAAVSISKKKFSLFDVNCGLLLFIREDTNVVINEASSQTHFVRMERETRGLTNSRSHESFVALNCADLSAIKTVN